jgi:hypothetical protein
MMAELRAMKKEAFFGCNMINEYFGLQKEIYR